MRHEDFDLANKAFVLMSVAERELVLVEFAKLQYPSVRDRFFESVYRIVRKNQDTQVQR